MNRQRPTPLGHLLKAVTALALVVPLGSSSSAPPADARPEYDEIRLIPWDGATGDYFGLAVSVSGEYAVVGAPLDDDRGSDSGSVYIFRRGAATWSQQAKLTAEDGAEADEFGHSVSISGDYAIVGAPKDDDGGSQSGSAYIFRRDGSGWSQQAKLTAHDAASGDRFGRSVSISGEYAIVGAYLDNTPAMNAGSAYVFRRDGTDWTEEAKLTASYGGSDDLFGFSVSISGEYALVGAYVWHGYTGSAYVFKREGSSWSQQARLVAPDGAANDRFGLSVSLSGDQAIVGAPYEDQNGEDSGSVYFFVRKGTDWLPSGKLTALDGAPLDWFGYSVSLTGGRALIGAPFDIHGGVDCGSAYLFRQEGGTWAQQAKLAASEGARMDGFGYSVSLADGPPLVGVPYDDATGDDSGSAYLFRSMPDLSITKAVWPRYAEPGELVLYQLVFSNAGLSSATGVVITDVVPSELTSFSYSSSRTITPTGSVSYTWLVEDLAPGQGGAIALAGVLDASLTRGHTFTNTAAIASAMGDADPADNQASVRVTVPFRLYLPLVVRHGA